MRAILLLGATSAALAVGLAAYLGRERPSEVDLLALSLSEAEICGRVLEDVPADPANPGVAPLSVPIDPSQHSAELTVIGQDGGPAKAGETAHVTLTLTDIASGAPLTGQEMAGWMLMQRSAQVAAELPCRAKVQLLSQGRVTSRPDVDLNAARMLILNRDGTLLSVNPQTDFTITQMEDVIPLPGVPADWVMGADRRTIFVSLPVYSAVAVIDGAGFRMTGLIELPKGSMPTTLLARPDGSLAVYLSADGSVVIAHPDGSGLSDPVTVGPAPVVLSNGSAGRVFAVSASGQVTAFDGQTDRSAVLGSLPAGEPAIAVSVREDSVYATTSNAKSIHVYRGGTLAEVAEIAVDPGVFTLAKVPGSPRLLALNERMDKVRLIDTETNLSLGDTSVADAPVEVAFTEDYAYIRGLEGDHFTILERAELDAGRLTPLNVQSAAGPVQRREALARARLVAPYGHGALVANEDEAQAYYYMEGMNTPMGTVKTYGTGVQGIMTVEQGFVETRPGVYETDAVLPFAGTYDVPIAFHGDETVICLTASAEPGAEAAKAAADAPLVIAAESLPDPVAKTPETFVFTVADASGQPVAGLTDFRLLAFAPSGAWQARKWAQDLGGGRYAAEWTFPKSGRYGLSFETRAGHVALADSPPIYFSVHKPPAL
jgi:DNA-binding beta-propeller fold protein YncE